MRQVTGDGRDGVASSVAELRLHGVDTLVHVDHEGVEVHATLVRYLWGEGVEEEVHEHRLAGAYVAVQVEAFGDFLRGDADFGCVAREQSR